MFYNTLDTLFPQRSGGLNGAPTHLDQPLMLLQ